MNILLINNLFGAESVGGAEQVVFARAKRLQKEGNHVFVLSATKVGQETDLQVFEGIETKKVIPHNIAWYKDLPGKSSLFKVVWHVLNYVDTKTAHGIVDFCRKHRIETVETHNLIGISMQVPRALKKAGITHHHYLHDVQLVDPSGILPADHSRDSFYQRLYSFFIKMAFKRPDLIISPTNFLQTFYQDRAFFPECEWKIEHEEYNQKLEIKNQKCNSERKTYLFVGSLVKHKGMLELLSAWNKKIKQVDERLVIVGDGPLRSLVEKAASEDVSIDYRGRISHEDIGSVYREADVLVFPSQCIENRPNVIAEAMAYGLEIIAVNTGGVEEMVQGYGKVTLKSLDNFTF